MTEIGRADVTVIGGGPAGIAAAIAADGLRKTVILVNDQPAAGGQIWRRDITGSRPPRASDWLRRLEGTGARPLNGATVIDARVDGDDHLLTVEHGGRIEEVHTRRIILATGARELFLPFPGWTLPGVLGVGAVQAMVKGGLDVSGKRIVVAGSGPLLIAVAASLSRRGANIVKVCEQAPLSRMIGLTARLIAAPRLAREALGYASTAHPSAFCFGTLVASARGESRVREVVITDGSRPRTIPCDLLCVGFGLVPNSELAQLLGCDVSLTGIVVDDRQQTSVAGVYAAGECVGVAGVDAALAEGTIAGQCASGKAEIAMGLRRARGTARAWGARLESTFALRPELLALATPDTIVCRCEDVKMGDLDRGWTPRQAKLYTRTGMGPCQGRVCGPALRQLYGWSSDHVRPPIYPASLATLASDQAGPSVD